MRGLLIGEIDRLSSEATFAGGPISSSATYPFPSKSKTATRTSYVQTVQDPTVLYTLLTLAVPFDCVGARDEGNHMPGCWIR